jgi:uncharacterized protein
MRETCGGALAMEHNGDLYSCDHFVTPAYKLGNIRKDWLLPMVGSEEQQAFGNAKRDELPEICKSCDVRFVCNGGCPKDRFASGPFGKPENYLCDGYKAFFTTIRPAMEYMARELAARRPATSVMRRLALHPSANTD